MSVCGRMCSSRSSSDRPLTSLTGAIEFLKRPVLPGGRGALLRLDGVGVDVVAREAVFGGDEVGRDALRHEIGGDGERRDRPATRRRRRRCRRGSSIRRRRRSSGHAGRSSPAPPRNSPSSRPEAQKRLICTPGTVSPKPAASAPMRAMSPPASPTGSTQPITTSSIWAGFELVAVLDRLQRGRREMQRRGRMQRAVRPCRVRAACSHDRK